MRKDTCDGPQMPQLARMGMAHADAYGTEGVRELRLAISHVLRV
jgi:hypothetical protein